MINPDVTDYPLPDERWYPREAVEEGEQLMRAIEESAINPYDVRKPNDSGNSTIEQVHLKNLLPA